MLFLKNFIFIKNKDINNNFNQQINTLTGGTIDMSILEIVKMQERREGRHEEALEIARELKKEGLTIEFIAKTTKLSVEEIEALT